MPSAKVLNLFFILIIIGLGTILFWLKQETIIAQQTAQKAQIALQKSIERYAKGKAEDLMNYGKNYEDLEEYAFACDSYQKAFTTLDTIEACKKLPIYKEIIALKTENCTYKQ